MDRKHNAAAAAATGTCPVGLRLRAWIWPAALTLLAHSWLLLSGEAAAPKPASHAPTGRTLALQTRSSSESPRPEAAELIPTPAAQPLPATLSPRPSEQAEPVLNSAAGQQAEPIAIDVASASPVSVPATGEWSYLLLQNGQQGVARLSWQLADDGSYRLQLERELAGRTLPAWLSQGRLDALGLAPERFAQQRRGRDTQATNFRRDEGLISYSASPAQAPLTPGAQDRLSWWLQLAARVDGAPQRFAAGSSVVLTVAGLRGAPRELVFDVLGMEALDLPGRSLPAALHLRRLGVETYDGSIDVWLDPAHGHWPVRLIFGQTLAGHWELQLLAPPP
ncbi:DUF3108 domain-containing protein [Roseateles sp. GG27B]